MKQLRYITLCLLLAALSVGTMTSCSVLEEAPEQGAIPQGTLHAGFTVTLSNGNEGSASRSEGFLGEGYDAGEGYENFIDLEGGDYRVVFYTHETTPDGNVVSECMGTMDGVLVERLSENEYSKTYRIRGVLPVDVSEYIRAGNHIKVAFLANWHNRYEMAREGLALSDLYNAQFDFSDDMTVLSADNRVPMFGITNPLLLSFDRDKFADVGMVHLLRAYAKVEVVANTQGAIIDYVTLTHHFDAGCMAPWGVDKQSDYVHGNYNDDYTASPNVPQTASVVDRRLPFVRIQEDGAEDRWVIYIPEFDNSRSAFGVRPQIKIRFNGYDADDTLEFKFYGSENAGYFNIMRNNWYRFRVLKSSYFYVMVDVVPYISVDLNPGFGFDELLTRPPVVGERPWWVVIEEDEQKDL